MRHPIVVVRLTLFPAVAPAMEGDDPLLSKVMIDPLEWRDRRGGDPLVWDAQLRLGRDLDKPWLKGEGEYRHDRIAKARLQTLYSRAITPFRDLQTGWRHDFRPRPGRDWLAVGVQGLAPYLFDLEATLFVGGNGQAVARLKTDYERLLTQRLVLAPEPEVNLHSRADRATGIGPGVSDLSLRLRYEIRRELALYVGLEWSQRFGQTTDFAREEGEATDEVQWIAGGRVWF